MNETSQIIFMQARLIRLASKKWNTNIQKAAAFMNQYGLLELIVSCFDTFHMEGDNAIFYELEQILKSKGVDVVAELGA